MSTRSRRIRTSLIDISPPRTRRVGVSPTRSPARSRKSSPPSTRGTSPARKSPSRKSPSRKPVPKYPARKSPSRATTKETIVVTEKSPAKRPAIKSDTGPVSTPSLTDLSPQFEIYRSTRSKRLEYSIKLDTSSSTLNEIPTETKNGLKASDDFYGLRNRRPAEEIAIRRSSIRDSEDSIPYIRQSISKSMSKSVSKSLDTYSDVEHSEDELVREKSKSQSVMRKLATPLSNIGNFTHVTDRWEFGGRIGSALLMILIPLSVFAILTSCSKSCSHKILLDVSTYKSLPQLFSLQVFLYFFVQLIIQAVFAIVPILGKKAPRMDESGSKYCFNALFSSIFTISLFYMLDFWQLINKYTILNEYLRLAFISYTFAVILSIITYMKSRKADIYELNPYGNTGYVLYDYFMGREIHSHVKGLDIKIWITRISNINVLILSALFFTRGLDLQWNVNDKITFDNYKELLNKVQLQPTILLFSMMQITYILCCFIIREYKITSTFFWNSEGVGYLQIVASALYPFYFTTISKYVADTELSLSTNTLISASVLFVLGIYLMLISNNIKYEFRKNPLHPSLAKLNSMPTFHGKKLLVSNIWGVLRHPNYTGDILIHISLALPGILSHQVIAAAPALLTIAVLIHRSLRDDARCKRRYGSAWQRYCKKVPSTIIPKVL